MDSFAWAPVSQTAALAGRSAVSDAGGGALVPSMLGFQLPPAAGLGHLSVDSGVVEQAVRSSCFGAGNGATTTASASNIIAEGPFGRRGDHKNAELELGGGGHDDAPSAGAGAGAGDCYSPGPDSNKRKRSNEDVLGTHQDQAKAPNASTDCANESARSKGNELEEDDGPAAAATGGKKKGKGVKEPDEPDKEGYIHVRVRKGQATNRHSLAERLRREKISERMKLLQDLVPGCSKVTGKAVMLDEIINYVQSLQRQVEFLSMKLASDSPSLNIEGLLSKNRLICFPGAASSAPVGFSFYQETMPEPQRLSQSGMLQRGVHGMGNGPDVYRTVMQEQLNEKDLFRDAASQMHHTLDQSSFHDVAQMGYRSVIGSEDLSVRADQDGFHM